MRTLIASSLLSLSLVACIQPHDDPHPVASALPTADDVRIDLPDRVSKPGDASLVGEIAPWYVVTRDVTRNLNGGTAWVLILVHTIVQFPATSTDGATATWGPWSDALDPAEYKLEVTAIGDGSYDWALSGKNKTTPGSAFEVVIGGNAVPSVPEGHGTGSFTIDFDAGARVNPIDSNGQRGVIDIAYDLDARHLDMAVSTIENRDGTDVPVDYAYEYTEAADGGGDMVFQIRVDTEDAGPAAEDATLRSRWLATGAGRADLRFENGDLAVQATGAQCWDTSFRNVYSEFSFDATLTEGTLADCAFTTADLPE